MTLKTLLLVVLLTLAVAGGVNASPYYLYITTTIAGANTQIDVNHTSSWTFTPTSNWRLGGGIFVIKNGPKTEQNIDLTLAPPEPGGNISLTPVGNSYISSTFGFSSGILLTAGTAYTLTLHSATGDAGDVQYFFKGNGQEFGFKDLAGNVTTDYNNTNYGGAPPIFTPEPGTWMLAAGGLGLVVASRRRRHA